MQKIRSAAHREIPQNRARSRVVGAVRAGYGGGGGRDTRERVTARRKQQRASQCAPDDRTLRQYTAHTMSRSLPGIIVILSCLSSRLESRTVSPIEYGYADSSRNAYAGYAGGPGSAPAVVYGYGHRSMPGPGAKVRRGRDDDGAQAHAPYESADTYEYMNNPGSKSDRSRVPKTEKRPPGDDDVELIGGESPVVAAASYKKHGKKKRKTASARGGSNHGNGGVGYSVSEPDVESSSSEDLAAKRPRKKKNSDGRGTTVSSSSAKGDKTGNGDAAAGPVSGHNVHEKNEFTKKQRFFDEEHVKNPAENGGGGGKKAQKERKRTQRQRYPPPYGPAADRERPARAQKAVLLQWPAAIPVRDDRYRQARPRLSTGYGQIVALR